MVYYSISQDARLAPDTTSRSRSNGTGNQERGHMGTITITESRTDAMRRLLVVAKESGVRLGVDQHGDFYATSVSEPGRLYPVGPESCGCRGFSTRRRCRHLAALWSHLGYLDNDPDPEPACPSCHGAGQVTQHHSRWIGGGTLGFRDQWSTLATCPACHGAEVAA